MAREDWRDDENERIRRREDFGQADYSNDYAYDPRSRSGYRADEEYRDKDDYGQADYTTDWAYDPERGSFRRTADGRPFVRDERPREGRSWTDKAADFFGGGPRHTEAEARRLEAERRDHEARRRRRGPSDRVLWAVIMERLDEARVDSRDVEVSVRDGEVTLDGTVRRVADKRRVEDLVYVDGVRHVQNNLRPRDIDRHWTFL